jgi:hypothetical protein
MSSTFGFGAIIKALTASGNSSLIPSAIQALGVGNSVSSKVTAMLNQLAAEMTSPAAVAQIVTNIESTPGVPPTVLPLLEDLRRPGITPLQVSQTIAAIEAAVTSANQFSITNLL